MGVGRALLVTACGGRSDPGCHHGPPGSCKLFPGTVSERPKDHVSKTCVGATPPWVQIPPVPPKGPIVFLTSMVRDTRLTRRTPGSGRGFFSFRGRSSARSGFRSTGGPEAARRLLAVLVLGEFGGLASRSSGNGRSTVDDGRRLGPRTVSRSRSIFPWPVGRRCRASICG